MRILKGFKWLVAALAIIGSTANADIIIDNQSIPSADIDSISISPASGNLFVSTIPGYAVTRVVVGIDSVAITNFTVSPGTIVAGGSATLSWSTSNANSCTASGGVGGWAGSAINTNGSQTINTTTVGSHQFTLTCEGLEAGDTAAASVVLDVNEVGSVEITSFTASPANIDAGGTTTLSWSTQNATSCTPSGGAGGWNSLTIGTQSSGTPISVTTVGTYSFTLTCQDGSGGQDSSTSVVTVNEGTSCPSTALAGDIDDWKSFWLVDFPKPGYDNRYATIPRYGYYALKFNTADIVANGKLVTIETTVTDGVRLGSISQCPGDFDVPLLCTKVWGISGGIRWATDGRTDACQLQPNTDYYFNVTYTDGTNPSTTTCNSSPCITTFQAIQR